MKVLLEHRFVWDFIPTKMERSIFSVISPIQPMVIVIIEMQMDYPLAPCVDGGFLVLNEGQYWCANLFSPYSNLG